MAAEIDYDTRRVREGEPDIDYVQHAATRRNDPASHSIDVDDTEPSLVPDATKSADPADPNQFSFDEDLSMPVVAQRANEFTCSRCFLVHHRTRYARTLRSKPICRDCS